MDRRTFLKLTALSTCIAGKTYAKESAALDDEQPRRIATVVPRMRAIPLERRWALSRNPENKTLSQLNALAPELDEIEVDNGLSDMPVEMPLRVAAWNMLWARHWREGVQLIQQHPCLKDADVLLLSEMDLGVPRSANEHTTREMATALGMNYAYCVEFLELPRDGDLKRTEEMETASFGLLGNAILSRRPLKNVRMLRFPGIGLWYGSEQHRLGGCNSLFAEIEAEGRTVTVICAHLESTFSENGLRMGHVTGMVEELNAQASGMPVILGGDFNAAPKSEAIQVLRTAGFQVDEANKLDTKTVQILKDGKAGLGYAHIDYMAVRGLEIVKDTPEVIPALSNEGNDVQLISDHAIVTAAVSL